jgi:hypothetical protein
MLLKRTAYFDPDQLLMLRRMSEARRCNRQVVIREAIEAYLRKARRRKAQTTEPTPGRR